MPVGCYSTKHASDRYKDGCSNEVAEYSSNSARS